MRPTVMERLRLLNRVDLALLLVEDSPEDAADLRRLRAVLLAPCDPRLDVRQYEAELPGAFDAAERLLVRAASGALRVQGRTKKEDIAQLLVLVRNAK